MIIMIIVMMMVMNDNETSSARLRAETPFAPVTHFTVHWRKVKIFGNDFEATDQPGQKTSVLHISVSVLSAGQGAPPYKAS